MQVNDSRLWCVYKLVHYFQHIRKRTTNNNTELRVHVSEPALFLVYSRKLCAFINFLYRHFIPRLFRGDIHVKEVHVDHAS